MSSQQPLFFGADADTAHDFLLRLAGWMLDGVDDDAKPRARRELRQAIERDARVSGQSHRLEKHLGQHDG